MEINAQQLLKILPHRYPFLLVDRVLEVEAGKSAVAIKNVTINEAFFVGHFPDHPVMPGVLIVEMLAQTGGVMLLLPGGSRGKLAYLGGIDKARFRKPVFPGDTLTAHVELLKARGNISWVKATAKVGDKIVCEAELSFAIVARENVEI